MTGLFAVTVTLALPDLGVGAQAAISVDTVTVGDPGNSAGATGYGAVSCACNIGRYEVTVGQVLRIPRRRAKDRHLRSTQGNRILTDE